MLPVTVRESLGGPGDWPSLARDMSQTSPRPHQVVDVLVLSDLHKATDLKATAIAFLLAHKEEVFNQPDWKNKLKVAPTAWSQSKIFSLRATQTCCWRCSSLLWRPRAAPLPGTSTLDTGCAAAPCTWEHGRSIETM